MSTKIYNAYRLSSLSSIHKLTEWLHKLRKEHFNYVLEKMRAGVPGDLSYEETRKRYVEISQRMQQSLETQLNDYLNFQSSVCIIPHKKEIYVIFFLGNYMDTAAKSSFFKKNLRDFHYQNQTDMPDGMKASEWSYRRKVWDAISERGSTFGEMGYVFEIFGEMDCHRTFWKIDEELTKKFAVKN